MSSADGGTLVLSSIIISIPPDAAWGAGGTFSASIQTVDLFKRSVDNPPPNELLTDVASLNFAPEGGSNIPIPLIGQAISFTMILSDVGYYLLTKETEVCDGPVKMRIFPEALCSYFDHNASTWEQKGCKKTNMTETTVVCECTHLTDFSVIMPNYNLVEFQDIMQMDERSIVHHPVGIVTLGVLYFVFLVTLAYARYYDVQDQADHKSRREKEAKWMANLEGGVRESFWKRYKSQIQHKHTWFSLYFRKRGTSYRSVDRTCVTFISVLTIMSLNAYFYGKGQTWLGYGTIIVFSSLVSFIPLFGLEIIFTRIGPPGYKDSFELSHGLRPVPKNQCCQWWAYYRLPFWVAALLYLVLLAVAVCLSVVVMLFAFEFDTNGEFVCNGKGSSSWVVSVLIAIAVNIFLVQPFKIFAVCVFLHLLARQQPLPKMIELQDTSVLPVPSDESVG